MAVNRYDGSRAWYAISTYSGYEDKVADSIKQRIGSVDLKHCSRSNEQQLGRSIPRIHKRIQ